MTTPTPDQGASRTVAIVADDLTGSTDSVVQFREAGWTAYLLLSDHAPATDQQQLVATSRSLDTRPLPGEVAAERTRSAVAEQAAASDRLYVKIDSTMRGSVAGQVSGALEAWAVEHPDAVAIVCPAYPQMGRVIQDGQMSVHGVPLHRSPAGSDPVTPVPSSVLTELLPGSVSVPNRGTAQDLATVLAAAAEHSRQLVVDAAEDGDLRRLAEAVEILGTRAVCVGSAGLARHLAEVWRGAAVAQPPTRVQLTRAGKVVVSISSLNEVSFGQARHLAETLGERLERHELAVEELRDTAVITTRTREILAASTEKVDVILLQPSPRRAPGMAAEEAARAVARGLAEGVAAMVGTGGVAALVLVGGDGAQSALQEIGATALQVDRQVSEGVPLGRVVGGAAQGLPVVTKAGGFGSTTTITDVISELIDTKDD